jgi:putative aldouronate transport system substrate-binding protein
MKKGKERIKKLSCILFATAILAGTVAGCKSVAKPVAQSSSGPSQNVSLKILCPNYCDTSVITTSDPFKKLEKITNATITMQWSPAASYNDKFNVLMASNNLPDVAIVPDIKSAVFTDAVAGNQFWQLDSYLSSSEFANFKNINKVAITNTKTNGKSYVLPRERILKRQMVVYRADWAKTAGLGAPDTINKVYNMAKAFATGDYDGNGKKDTIGLMLSTSTDQGGGASKIDVVQSLTVANGGFNNWGLNNGKVQSVYDTQPYMNTMDLLRKMFGEGLISPDFPLITSTDVATKYVDTEKTGLWISTGIPGTSDALLLAKKKTDTSLTRKDIYGYTYLKDSKGSDRVPAETGFNGGIAFPKTSTKSVTQLKQLLAVWNVICGKEGQILVNNGVEGRNYTVVSEADKTAKQSDTNLNTKELSDLGQMGVTSVLAYTWYDDDIGAQLSHDRITYKSSDLINDVSVPLTSQTYSSSVSTLNKIIDETQFKYIMGKETKEQFQSDIKNWKSTGGDKEAQEYTASYNSSKK